MWTEVQNKTKILLRDGNTLKMEKADQARSWQHLNTVPQRNGSTAAATHPSCTEDCFSRGNGIVPGAIAAAVFITFLLSLYAVLWKCMVSPPQRKKRKVRIRERQGTPV
ncbi:uncharacterized protein ACJ7VT_008756 [Polymixia lowei]